MIDAGKQGFGPAMAQSEICALIGGTRRRGRALWSASRGAIRVFSGGSTKRSRRWRPSSLDWAVTPRHHRRQRRNIHIDRR